MARLYQKYIGRLPNLTEIYCFSPRVIGSELDQNAEEKLKDISKVEQTPRPFHFQKYYTIHKLPPEEKEELRLKSLVNRFIPEILPGRGARDFL